MSKKELCQNREFVKKEFVVHPFLFYAFGISEFSCNFAP
jgi:hypothetical protein